MLFANPNTTTSLNTPLDNVTRVHNINFSRGALEDLRVYLMGIEERNILVNTLERTLLSLQSLHSALEDEKNRTRHLLAEKRDLETLIRKKKKARHRYYLHQGVASFARKVVDATEQCATSLRRATTSSLDTLKLSETLKEAISKNSNSSNKRDASSTSVTSSVPGDTSASHRHLTPVSSHSSTINHETPNQQDKDVESWRQIDTMNDYSFCKTSSTMKHYREKGNSIVIMDITVEFNRGSDQCATDRLEILATDTIPDIVESWGAHHHLNEDQVKQLIKRLEQEEENAQSFPVIITVSMNDFAIQSPSSHCP